MTLLEPVRVVDRGQARPVPPRPAGLREKLVAAVRPEFRADDLVFDPRDPVFGGPPCVVAGCVRPARSRAMCWGHRQRWLVAGKPDPAAFAASTPADWVGHRPLPGCQITGCRYGQTGHGMCDRHLQQWDRAGRTNLAAWQRSEPSPPPSPPPATCRIAFCDLWARTTSLFCRSHHQRWRRLGRGDVDEFAASREDPGVGCEHIDLRCLPPHLRLEVQYVLQCRGEEKKAQVVPSKMQQVVRDVAATGVSSLLDQPEDFWRRFDPPPGRTRAGQRVFALDAFHRIEHLAFGSGWDVEYPREIWRLRHLGISEGAGPVTLDFGPIPQPWLKDLAKRWIRWRLTTGVSTGDVGMGIRAIRRLAAFLASPAVAAKSLAQLDRALLERYLADLHAHCASRESHLRHVSSLNAFLRAIRQHRWDTSLPGSAILFPEDYPKQQQRLPRALADHVMAQVEQPGNLHRWNNPAYRLATLILIRCGLRISDALKVGFDCVVTDADGAPYLRYTNHKMKREALVPVDEELRTEISDHQQRVLQHWPDGVAVLFPRPTRNIDGNQPISSNTYRDALHRWLKRCDIRDEHSKPVHLTPHQWRHSLGTKLINLDVPQEVVRRILDHDSHAMTAHYARLSDTTIRRHWEKARKVNATGERLTLDPDGPLAEAAWAKQRISRATQALPNGYCSLPLVKTCPHANACLTCPMFITTAEFLPQHHQHHQQLLQIITAAEARGHTRQAQMNRQVADNLEKIITTLEADDPQPSEAIDAS